MHKYFSGTPFRLIIKVSLVAFSYFYLFKQLSAEWDNITALGSQFSGLHYISLFYLSLILTLAFVNWFIEAKKWKLLVSEVKLVSFSESLAHILGGLSLGIFTPLRLGEIPGRAFFFEKEKRSQVALLAGINSIIQSLVTFIVGSVAFLAFSNAVFGGKNIQLAVYLFIILFILFIYFYKKIPFFNKVKQRISLISRHIFYKTVVYSFSRYTVFLFQYYFAYKLLGMDISMLLIFQNTAVILFLLYILPVLSAFDLGVRGAVSVWVFASYGIDSLPVFMAGSLIWLINIVLPSLLGGIYVLRHRIVAKTGNA